MPGCLRPMSDCSKGSTAITWAEAELAQILPRTPAKILTTIPHVAVVRASNYGGAVGDVTRFRNASQVYRLSGLCRGAMSRPARGARRLTFRVRARSSERGDHRSRQGAPPGASRLRSLRHGTTVTREAQRHGEVRAGAAGQSGHVRHDARPAALRPDPLVNEVRTGRRGRVKPTNHDVSRPRL
jgi:hypothetical protein